MTYQIKSVSDFKAGDIVKISRKRVAQVVQNGAGQTVVTFHGGHQGTFFGTERLGIYR